VGRQPWIVYGLLRTNAGRSPLVSTSSIIISLGGYVVVYVILIAVGVRLFLKEIRIGPEDPEAQRPPGEGAAGPRPDLALAY